MRELIAKKDSDELVAYVVGRFLQAGVETYLLFAVARTMTVEFGVNSEEEAEKLVVNYLKLLDSPCRHDSVNI